MDGARTTRVALYVTQRRIDRFAPLLGRAVSQIRSRWQWEMLPGRGISGA